MSQRSPAQHLAACVPDVFPQTCSIVNDIYIYAHPRTHFNPYGIYLKIQDHANCMLKMLIWLNAVAKIFQVCVSTLLCRF